MATCIGFATQIYFLFSDYITAFPWFSAKSHHVVQKYDNYRAISGTNTKIPKILDMNFMNNLNTQNSDKI